MKSSVASPVVARAEALLGQDPVMTFQADPGEPGTCCSVRLTKVRGPLHEARWVGLVLDHAAFADRVRLGMRPRFVVHGFLADHEGATPLVCGEAEVRIVGRLAEAGGAPAGLDGATASAVTALVGAHPFPGGDLVVVEVRPLAIQVDEGEGPSHGALPRT